MNIRELAENLGLEEEEYLELLDLLVETGMSDIDKYQKASDEGDIEGAVMAAHSLKGATANMGFMELSYMANELQDKAHNNRLEGAAKIIQSMREELKLIASHAGV